MTGPVGKLASDRIYRVQWIPGTDTLRGTCHCGAARTTEEPVALWEWLLSHPSGHQAPPPPVPVPPARTEVPV